jgi:hypothetical protein
MQYNAVGNDYLNCGAAFNCSVKDTGAPKTAVYKLLDSDLRFAQNAGADLRVTRSGSQRLHIFGARLSDVPSPEFEKLTAFLGPYTGPKYRGIPVDATTITDKFICGYQAWFRTPDDADDMGWIHWTGNWGNLSPKLISEDFWPDMAEFTAPERFAAPGFTNPDKTPADLFSSDVYRTILRHFQWMEAWGIDGVAVQRFTGGLGNPSLDGYRILTYIREAANRTGRTWFVEYDMTGTKEADLVPVMAKDWRYLVDVLRITEDDRYLKHGGKPVAGVFGWYKGRFTTDTANAILDIFQKPGSGQSFVYGAGAWYWNVEPFPADWKKVIYRMGAFQAWNCGDLMGEAPKRYAKTDYWAKDLADLAAHNVIWIPELFPGCSSDHRDNHEIALNVKDQFCPRRGGDFLWEQVVANYDVGSKSFFLGMFDEFDEGTQIAKVTGQPPVERKFLDYEGQPSDCYLCYTGQAAAMLKRQIPRQAAKPDCFKLTKPSIPEPLKPLEGAQVPSGQTKLTWSPAVPAQGAKAKVDGYMVELDGKATQMKGLFFQASLAPGPHFWRVQARNSLGNWSGWSLPSPFTVAP